MPGFYRNVPELLSQGDIVANVPWGLIEAPITLCRPDNNPLQGKSRHSTIDPWQMQGAAKPWSKAGTERLHAIGWNGIAMVMWHDCQISKSENQQRHKPDKEFAAVAPVLPFENIQAVDDQARVILKDGIRNGENHSYFFLPAVETGSFTLPESYVNFRYIWSIRQSALTERRVTIAEDQLPALYGALFGFLTRLRIDLDPRCPSCNAVVPLEMKPSAFD